MSELTLFVLRVGFLIALWVFVFFVIFALRSDLFGQKVRRMNASAAPTKSGAATAHNSAAGAHSAFLTSAQPVLDGSKPTGSTQLATSASGPLRLVITSGDLAGQELPLTENDVTIGRSSESTLVIQDDYTSTHHASLSLTDGTWVLTDLDSTNGTFLEGARVTAPVAVNLNTPITVGSITFEIRR